MLRNPLIAVLAVLSMGSVGAAADGLKAANLRCEYRTNPVAIDTLAPRFSWVLASPVRGDRQAAYRIVVSSRIDGARAGSGDLWDSGVVRSSNSVQVAYRGARLRSRQRAYWSVTVWDAAGRSHASAETGSFGMGLLARSDWTAKWVSCGGQASVGAERKELSAPVFRKAFTLPGTPRRAVVYATAAGLYELSINGRRVSQDLLRPGWTEYAVRMYYQAYDVTRLLQPGGNAIGAMVGDGWFGLHHNGRGNLALRVQMHVELAGGQTVLVQTDGSWRVTTAGPVRASDIYNGETYDARRELAGWSRAGFDDTRWSPVRVGFGPFRPKTVDVTDRVRAAVRQNGLEVMATNGNFGDPIYGAIKTLRVMYRRGGGPVHRAEAAENTMLTLPISPGELQIVTAEYGQVLPPADPSTAILQVHPGDAVRRTGALRARRITHREPGVAVVDFGQNFAGWVRLRVRGRAGDTVRMRFAEMLNPDGSIYTTNLRGARCTDTYTLRGGATETWEPRFTFHGFRYVELTGLRSPADSSTVTGIVLNSDAPMTSAFVSTNPMLNRLFQNILWGQRSNYLEVPTDCPQRDERMGWTGDAQAFIGTAVYNMDLAPFMTAWLRTFNDARDRDGGYPNVAPRGGGVSPAWGDAGVIIPWTLYQTYGDTRIIDEHWPNMQRWVRYLQERSKGLIRPAEGFGDWVNLGDDTPHEVISTAYFALSTRLMERMAEATGRRADAAAYHALFGRIREAYVRAFVAPDGRVKGNSQTAYLLTLAFDLAPTDQHPQIFMRLLERLEARNWHLSTGFLGVNLLLPVLAENGRSDLAWRLLTTTTYPSWLYSVSQGATTIWERWDGWRHDRGFQDPGMNSFNHYTFGSCGKWMMSTAAGIGMGTPAWGTVTIRPVPGGGVTSIRAHYDSIRGRVAVAWSVRGGRITMRVTVPTNVTAAVWVPTTRRSSVTESGRPAERSPGVRFRGEAPGAAIYQVGGGVYHFSAALPH